MQKKSIMDLSFEEIMNLIRGKYDVDVESVTIGNRTMKILQLKSMEEYVLKNVEQTLGALLPSDPGGEKTLSNDLLLEIMQMQWWTNIWEPSFVLALYMDKLPPQKNHRILEIGAGAGIVGIYAAMAGHDVTISDISEDALLFSRANALLNGCPQVSVVSIDWNIPYLGRPYELIIGSEVVYDRRNYDALIGFLDQALAPKGTIILAKNRDLKTPLFFERLVHRFKFKEKIVPISGSEGPIEIGLYAIRRKEE